MKRGPAIGISIGISLVIIAAVYAVSVEPMDENSTTNDDQPQTQETPSGDSGEGQRFHITLDDSVGSGDNP